MTRLLRARLITTVTYSCSSGAIGNQNWDEQILPEKTIPMKKPAQYPVAEVPRRHSKVEMTIGIGRGDVRSHFCKLNRYRGPVPDNLGCETLSPRPRPCRNSGTSTAVSLRGTSRTKNQKWSFTEN